MDYDKQADGAITPGQQEPESVGVEYGNLTDEEQKKKKELENLKTQRAKECATEFNKLMEKYNCYPDISLTLSTTGQITGAITIKAK